MNIEKGNIWKYWKLGEYCCVTSNGFVKTNGDAVMGRGVAYQATILIPGIKTRVGHAIKNDGNHVHIFDDIKIITFPVKHHWVEQADLTLIQRSAYELIVVADINRLNRVYLTKPGCHNGRRTWDEVAPLLSLLDERFVVVDYA